MTNLFLIGYRGTGKTVLGKKVADKLGREFVDTDKIITELAGESIAEIFSNDGEEKFREIETVALQQASEKKNCVISCGGGIIVKERNLLILKTGVVCLLKANAETIYKRTYGDTNRPSLTKKDPFDEIKHLLAMRNENYEKAKDFEINTIEKEIDVCVKEIIDKFNKFSKK